MKVSDKLKNKLARDGVDLEHIQEYADAQHDAAGSRERQQQAQKELNKVSSADIVNCLTNQTAGILADYEMRDRERESRRREENLDDEIDKYYDDIKGENLAEDRKKLNSSEI